MIEFRASSVGRLMADPRTKADGILPKGAKTFVRELGAKAMKAARNAKNRRAYADIQKACVTRKAEIENITDVEVKETA